MRADGYDAEGESVLMKDKPRSVSDRRIAFRRFVIHFVLARSAACCVESSQS